jgi:hypothetical protein
MIMLDFVINLLWALAGVALGGYILLFGRRALWATLGIIGLAATSNLLAELIAGAASGWDLLEQQAWGLLGIALAASALGVFLGWAKPALAGALIGFVAGANLALWFYEIVFYGVTAVAHLSEQIAVGIELGLVLIGGLAGLWFVRRYRDEGLILITMALGTEMIFRALGLSESSSLTAVVILSLALVSVIVQYADYLRELKASTPLTVPEPALPDLTSSAPS